MIMDGRADFDPKGLVWESFRIEGITLEECRSIFLDWALSLSTSEPKPAIEALLLRHMTADDDHPMKQVLREGLAEQPAPGRRGGRAARVGS
ncbi:hypothetical protein DD557_05200 [Thalassobacter stenotrophicus]|uniref:Uncharacterized protein n=3 Tax=Thalassobacter stenotrophicus TaxID=266809 RepID=A0A0N7LTL9_9RHOB|nr:hypothetical protein [Thalassobacter stenotrophicus]PVZ48182.1 hypothetical protein DD557_05200 [Thalassobacter stenotrophicus]CUH61066.1 hypothetical protein THS5294_02366 [Thalassobacter stenotrophicus]SHI56135.1 hypothetical protein SAMN02744035_00891 [Thalassobacter stenotrophicus DSM 16310]